MDYISFNELNYVNSQSNAIRTGLIMFVDDQKKDIYEALNIGNWQSILTNEAIKDIILNPTLDGLNTLIAAKEIGVFNRVRCILTALLNSGEYDISNRVIDIIDKRGAEFRRGELVSRIQLKKKDVPEKIEQEDVADLKAQIAQLQAMVAQMAQAQQPAKEEVKPATTAAKKTRAKKETTK